MQALVGALSEFLRRHDATSVRVIDDGFTGELFDRGNNEFKMAFAYRSGDLISLVDPSPGVCHFWRNLKSTLERIDLFLGRDQTLGNFL